MSKRRAPKAGTINHGSFYHMDRDEIIDLRTKLAAMEKRMREVAEETKEFEKVRVEPEVEAHRWRYIRAKLLEGIEESASKKEDGT